jgi:hypothetical protein
MTYKKKDKPDMGYVVCLERNLLRAKKNLLELLILTKKHRNLTFHEQEVALFLIAEDVSRVKIGIPRRSVRCKIE